MRSPLAPVPLDARSRRYAQLYAGLVLYGVSDSLLVLAGLGLDPWDILHQGLSRSLGLGIGTWTILVGAAVLLAWWPLRQRPGVGTATNVVLIGLVVNATLAVLTAPHGLGTRIALLIAGVGLNALATGAYIGAGLGSGPRDGLTTGMAARGHSIRIVRTSVEVGVLLSGWLLGGTVGLGTVLYALTIGPLTHLTIPALAIGSRARSAARPARGTGSGGFPPARETLSREERPWPLLAVRGADPTPKRRR